jgi:diguanylate cyclase (GGDEF)-like protein/PAS domain S-box-containing protein
MVGGLAGPTRHRALALISFQYLSYSLPLFAASLLAGYLAWLSWRQEGALGRGAFGWLMLAVWIWTTTSGLEKLLVGLPAKTLCSQVQYLGISATPPLWLLTALQFGRRERWLRSRAVWPLWIIPSITVLLAATNGLHHAVWSEVRLGTGAAQGMGIYLHGPWFWVAAAYSYLLFVAGTLVLSRAVLFLPGVFQRHGIVLMLAAFLPGLANVAYLARATPLPGLDLTPFAFSVSGLGLAWSVLRLRMFDLRPVARDTLVEQLRDGVLVVDPERRVVDVNPSARQLLFSGRADLIGRDLEELLPELVADLAARQDPKPRRQLIMREAPPVVLETTVTPLRDSGGQAAGWLLVLHDVTEQQQLVTLQQEAHERLQDQLTEIKLLQAELHERAIRDGLTGLYNRRYLEELLDGLIAAHDRASEMAIVMVDIDSFKKLNDTYGHAVGDRVLQCLSEVLREGASASDHPCRYGGEEFVVVIEGASVPAAVARAEQWREDLARRSDPPVTLSAGVAVFPTHGWDADGLLRAADDALYAAKAGGRNRVCASTARRKEERRHALH